GIRVVLIVTCMYVELGVQNTLICHVTGFYPAPVNITWNKNEQKVTEGTSTSVPFPNKDGSFKQTSRLEFIPKQGDVYSCTKENHSYRTNNVNMTVHHERLISN
uniref:Ig-like domain-containing protein n=1 Tax=Astatotilapia calliptera TaxID=8154 RepID=A0A3P8NL00_ASTCA